MADPPKDDRSIVSLCPKCKRIMWTGTTCAHGTVPPPDKDAPREPGTGPDGRKLTGGTPR